MTRPASRAAVGGGGPPAGGLRVPPNSAEAETGLLGCVLLDSVRVLDQCASKRLGPDCFYNPVHQRLFAVFAEMDQRQQPVDLLTVAGRLRDLGELEALGGDAYLQRLVDQTPTVEHASFYVDLVLQKYLLRTLLDRTRQVAEECYGAGDRDAMEVLGRAEQAVLEVGDFQGPAQAAWPQRVETVSNEMCRLLAEGGKTLTGLSTGFQKLDKILLGLQPSEMIVLAARPSQGKTSLAMNIAENVACGMNPLTGYGSGDRRPRPVAVFSLEMSAESLVRRMLCSRAGVAWDRIVGGYCDKDEQRRLVTAAHELMEARIHVDDTPALDAPQLRARARRMKKSHGIELIVIDYLQLLQFPGFEKEGRQRETQAISGALKAMAKELRVPVLVLSQLNRQPETRDTKGVPKLSDLRDSGSIEQDADVVMLLRQPGKNKGDPRHAESEINPGLTVVDVAKQRNGRTGEIDLFFDGRYTRFGDPQDAGTDAAQIRPTEGGTDE
jgi:replicative DNA helicase